MVSKKIQYSESFYTKLIVILGIGLIIFGLYNTFLSSALDGIVGKSIEEAKEANRPAVISLTVITDSSCNDCFDIQTTVDDIKKANVDITHEKSLDLNSDEAKELIAKYSILKIPTVVITGETNKTNIKSMEEKGDVLLFAKAAPPYTDAITSRIKGRVTSILIQDPACDKCAGLNQLISTIKQSGVKIISERTINIGSGEASSLISKYKITSLPALVFSSDLSVYDTDVVNSWVQVGSVEGDGSYVTRTKTPPYLDLSTGNVVGLVTLIALEDSTCEECYDAMTLHKQVLRRMALVLEEERTVDISSDEGKALIEKYNIDKVPTVILKGDAGEYQQLTSVWPSVGTTEDDGTLVFRKVEVLRQTYRDLTTGEVVKT